ncbi:(2E,6E)-farnesyl diphosphate synthase [Aliikangiella sp. G2MR2-5]|uniref:(2E,6E)-farnesyl diphosphate synthase n=1 Tax=Aliikangiella sp. G2MR2-5 TaxID=2788943 RepID=UPI0018A90854|nr:farnesyl diphosphate synthase [Aliikangiella sp. G2MR2-5]
MPHRHFLESVQRDTNQLLDHYLPAATTIPQRLHEAMRHSALNPGKRLRPALVFATGEMLGLERPALNVPAIAVELIHAYSLIHDDLPCMDDDDLRRGIPTCHVAFDEATAVLAGDALQTLAFELLASSDDLAVRPVTRLKMIVELAKASGSLGMGGGQAIDLALTNKKTDIETLESMHRMKTGALIDISVLLGYYCSEINDQQVAKKLSIYSQSLGLAFQIRDDILDIESDTETLGKPQGSDLEKNKSTFPALLGLEGAKRRAAELVEQSLEALHELPYKSDNLANFARYIIQRDF